MGCNGGGIDELFEMGRDLFANETDGGGDAHPNHGAKIFSILPQNRSILAGDAGDHGPPGVAHKRSDSLLVDGMTYQSLAGAVSRDADVNSLFSERGTSHTVGILNRPRALRPFSPTPGERVRDPLEDQGLEIPKSKVEDEDGDKGGESASARTVVQITPPEGSSPEGYKEDAVIDEEDKMDEESVSDRRESRERERRWSVTDDGVVSD